MLFFVGLILFYCVSGFGSLICPANCAEYHVIRQHANKGSVLEDNSFRLGIGQRLRTIYFLLPLALRGIDSHLLMEPY